MAYNEFAYFYDEFNGEADYEALYAHIKKELEAHGIHDGILADLGCGTGEHFHEQFCEYTYDLDTIRAALEKHGFALESVCDGESFGPLTDESERYFFCAVKQYTQLEER